MTEPTEGDVGRDLAADLATCEAASPGPWDSSPQKGIPGHCFVAQVWDAGGKALAEVEPTVKEQEASATAAMIAAAREGWPAAIRRARYAEAVLNTPVVAIVDSQRAEIARLKDAAEKLADLSRPRPIAEWDLDDGNVVWWRLPVEESPWVGTPLDGEWLGDYYTHWTPLLLPDEGTARAN